MKISPKEANGVNQVIFDVMRGDNVLMTIELCFKEGGKLSRITAGRDEGNNSLEEGMETSEYKGDLIEFELGARYQQTILFLSGERYSTHFGYKGLWPNATLS